MCLFWNIGRPDEETAQKLDEVYARLAPQAESFSVLTGYSTDDGYEAVRQAIRDHPELGGPEEKRFRWSRPYTTAEWVDQLPTHSDHAAMDPEQLDEVLSAVALVIDRLGGSFEMGYSTLLLSATRLGSHRG
jgi:hypothetical protein